VAQPPSAVRLPAAQPRAAVPHSPNRRIARRYSCTRRPSRWGEGS